MQKEAFIYTVEVAGPTLNFLTPQAAKKAVRLLNNALKEAECLALR